MAVRTRGQNSGLDFHSVPPLIENPHCGTLRCVRSKLTQIKQDPQRDRTVRGNEKETANTAGILTPSHRWRDCRNVDGEHFAGLIPGTDSHAVNRHVGVPDTWRDKSRTPC